MNKYDVVVIGGGAAGLSAALVLGRARRHVALVDAGQPRNAPAAHMQGFLGSDGLPPGDLLAAGREEVRGYGVELIPGIASGVSALSGDDPSSPPAFGVRLEDGSMLRSRRILVTTGLRDEIPDLPGVAERWGRDLLHCPYCHGYEVRDRPLGVLGGNAAAITHAHLIRQWSDDVVFFFHNGRGLPDAHRPQPDQRPVACRQRPGPAHLRRDHRVPIAVYGSMPRLHRIRGNLLTRRAA